ncbi:hypothetical protein BDB01DRAFT_807939 [Pilobolus umbonatus]|nr:hypothetical protein BDB01DRAFT_807939 [Pilobolus umbonatus]
MSDSDGYNELSSANLIKNIIGDLFSYNTIKRKRILQYYFFEDAALSSPIMSTIGVNNIQYIYTVWQTLNRIEPKITNIVFNGQTAVIHLIHNISPTILPSFAKLEVPAITTLHFKETEYDSGLLKIYRQEDSWTLEGIIQSIPLLSFWYTYVLRVVMGKLLSTTGDILDSAASHAQKMSMRSREIQQFGHEVAIENMERLDEYRSDLKDRYLEGLRNWGDCYLEPTYPSDDYRLAPIRKERGEMTEDQIYFLDG